MNLTIEKINARKSIRKRILEHLYELYYSGGPEWPSKNKVEGIIGSKKELYIDNEHHKAYHYLFTKGLIEITSLTPNAITSEDERLAIMITAKGIDFIEEIVLDDKEDTKNNRLL